MDDLDRARQYQDLLNQEAVSRRVEEPQLIWTGECHNCEAPVEKPKRFCDGDCADEWEEFCNKRGRA